MGWRYVLYSTGILVLTMSVGRLTVVKLKETPKYLIGEGKDAQIVEDFQVLAKKYNRPCSITLEKLEACGVVRSAHGCKKFSVSEFTGHFRGPFASKIFIRSTLSIWLSWALIGLGYPLFYVYLESYLASRGEEFHISTAETWRNYFFVTLSGIPVSLPISTFALNRSLTCP